MFISALGILIYGLRLRNCLNFLKTGLKMSFCIFIGEIFLYATHQLIQFHIT